MEGRTQGTLCSTPLPRERWQQGQAWAGMGRPDTRTCTRRSDASEVRLCLVLCIATMLAVAAAFPAPAPLGHDASARGRHNRAAGARALIAQLGGLPTLFSGEGRRGLVLSERERGKDNPAPDLYHYDYPRMCYHADAAWHADLTELYAQHLPFGDDVRVLDLMSSWVSHYPTDRRWGRVTGLGMNAEELQKNRQLDFWHTQDLNVNRQVLSVLAACLKPAKGSVNDPDQMLAGHFRSSATVCPPSPLPSPCSI